MTSEMEESYKSAEEFSIQELKELEFPSWEESSLSDESSELQSQEEQPIDVKKLSSKDLNEFQYKDLQTFQRCIQEASVLVASQLKYEDVAIFYGFTKCGKSSLINYLLDNELIGENRHQCMPIFLNTVFNLHGPEIGLESEAKTSIPKRWENQERFPNLGLIDTPGYDDNRGPIRDLIGTYYVYEIFKNVKSVKIVLVIDITDIINDRINSFITILHTIENMLNGNMPECFSSIIVIFTKVPYQLYNNDVDKEFINEILRLKILKQSNMQISQTVKNFVQYLIENNNNIGLFMKAQEGPITNDIEVGITEAIKDADAMKEDILKSIVPSIANGSKIFLYTISKNLLFEEDFKIFHSKITTIFNDQLKEYVKIENSNTSKDQLYFSIYELKTKKDKLEEILDSNYTLHEKVRTLKNIIPQIENETIKLLDKSKLIEFIDALINSKVNEEFDFQLQRTFQKIISRIDNIIVNIRFKLNDIDKKEYNDCLQKIQKEYSLKMEELKKETKILKEHNENLKSNYEELKQKLKNIYDKTKDSKCTIL